jgi:cytochrome o ubiquinol oxidase subunit 3
MSQQFALTSEQQASTSKTLLGFWIYLMTDCVLFASLFATFAVLRTGTFGGPTGQDIFNLPYILVETLALLVSSFTCGLAILAARRGAQQQVVTWLVVTFALGLVFLVMELTEFRHLVVDGNSWRRSGFLSSYFTLVGTHGLHITVGLVWMGSMIVKVLRSGLSSAGIRKLMMLSLFWHFLDLVWIFIFTIVYLFGVIPV